MGFVRLREITFSLTKRREIRDGFTQRYLGDAACKLSIGYSLDLLYRESAYRWRNGLLSPYIYHHLLAALNDKLPIGHKKREGCYASPFRVTLRFKYLRI